MSAKASLQTVALCAFVALLIYSSIRFYGQPFPPNFPIVHGIYHLLHGERLDPSNDRPFPKDGDYSYSGSESIKIGEKGPTIYGQDQRVIFSAANTAIFIRFVAEYGATIPDISAIAPHPTLRVGDSTFPPRKITVQSESATSLLCRFEFPPLTSIKSESLALALNGDATFEFANPTPYVPYQERVGTNVWWFVGAACWVPIFILLSLMSSTKKGLDEVLHEWRILDKERSYAARTIGWADDDIDKQERHRAAQDTLSRAERIIMSFYDSRLRGSPDSLWLVIGMLSLIVIVAIVGWVLNSSLSVPPLITHSPAGTATSLLSRLVVLEQFRSATRTFMLVGLLVVLTAITANVLLSIQRAKWVSRQAVDEHLDRLHVEFEEKLLLRLKHAEDSIEQVVAALTKIRKGADGVRERLANQLATFDKVIVEVCEEERMAVNAEMTKTRTALRENQRS